MIRELGGDQRTILLTTRALPYRNFELTGTQRVELTWLPGSPEATATILGPTEEPTTINGEWKTKYLGENTAPPFTVDGTAIRTASDACWLIDEVRRMGQLLEVSWLDIVRRGFLKKFRQTWRTAYDVAWEMEFDWISQGDSVGAAVFATPETVGNVFNVLKTQEQKLDDVGTPSAFPMRGSILGTLQGLQQNIENLINGIQDTVQNLSDKVLSPVRAVRGIIASLKGIKDECTIMRDFLDARSSELSEKPIQDQTYSERLASALYREELTAWAQEMARQAVEQQAQLEHTISTDVLGTYVAKAGEDLRDVSRLFYSTPFEWRRILVFNDFDSAELAAGQVVLVPKINPNQAGQQSPGD